MDKLTPEPDITSETPVVRPLGPVELETPVGEVLYLDARFLTNGPATFPDGEKVATIMMVLPVSDEGLLLGGIAQFTPDEARTFAATLCQTADKIDGGVKQ